MLQLILSVCYGHWGILPRECKFQNLNLLKSFHQPGNFSYCVSDQSKIEHHSGPRKRWISDLTTFLTAPGADQACS